MYRETNLKIKLNELISVCSIIMKKTSHTKQVVSVRSSTLIKPKIRNQYLKNVNLLFIFYHSLLSVVLWICENISN